MENLIVDLQSPCPILESDDYALERRRTSAPRAVAVRGGRDPSPIDG